MGIFLSELQHLPACKTFRVGLWPSWRLEKLGEDVIRSQSYEVVQARFESKSSDSKSSTQQITFSAESCYQLLLNFTPHQSKSMGGMLWRKGQNKRARKFFLRMCSGTSCMSESPGEPTRNADSLYYCTITLWNPGICILNKGLGDSTASRLGISRAEVSTLAACENHLGDFYFF